MGRYIMTPKTYNRFKTKGYNLECKICDVPIHIGDEVESKTGSGKGPKLYHASCYDEYHLDVNGSQLRNGLGNIIRVDEDE